jgi:hypothetical protein
MGLKPQILNGEAMRTRQVLLGLFVVSCTPSGFQVEDDDGEDLTSEAGIEGGDGGGMDAWPDADAGPVACYVDRDGDGVGGGDPVPCDLVLDSGLAQARDAGPAPDGGSGDAGADGGEGGDVDSPTVMPAVVNEGGDCDDDDSRRAPGFNEVCDGVDNDCDEEVDERINNACGGPCLAPLEHEPGELCANGLLGACARTGKYVCATAQSVQCDAPAQTPSSEVCGDDLDNDCDGAVDEPDAVDAVTWFQDCDGDGYATSTAGSRKACLQPANVGSCGWTAIVPQVATGTNWDCDDSRAAYSPDSSFGQPPAGSTSWDLNCDGRLDPASSVNIRICSGSIITKLNAGDERCSASSISVGGCYIWKDGTGRYVARPAESSACPDAPWRVTTHLDPFDLVPVCDVQAAPAVWHCR